MNTLSPDTAARPPRALLSGGRASARRRLVAAVAAACMLLPPAHATAGAGQPGADVSVREEKGTYQIEARFVVAQPASVAFAVLTDYEQIPRFMPDVRTSTVRERSEGRAVVEQEATARFMMFSKRVHLVLDVHAAEGVIRFRDGCGKSFTRYEGSWQIRDVEGGAAITYQLTAAPAFDVPEFLLKRLFRRDAVQMIERLQREIASRVP